MRATVNARWYGQITLPKKVEPTGEGLTTMLPLVCIDTCRLCHCGAHSTTMTTPTFPGGAPTCQTLSTSSNDQICYAPRTVERKSHHRSAAAVQLSVRTDFSGTSMRARPV